MGQGDLIYYQADFIIGGKMVFDWVTYNEIEEVVPYSTSGQAQCAPRCGPFYLMPADTGSKTPNSKLGIQVSTLADSFFPTFFFIEHRTSSTFRNAVLIHWSENRGYWYSNSVLTDCTPGTSSWTDAGCTAGSSIVLDVGTPSDSKEITVEVGALTTSGSFPVTIITEAPPTLVPVPEPTLAPTLSPQPTIWCQDFTLEMSDSYGDGW
jgi:hypothetical protein